MAILKPFSVRRSSRRIKVMLLTAWGLAVLLSLPQTVVFHVEKHPQFQWYEQCVTIFFTSTLSREYEFYYFLMGMIFLYVLPFIVILVTYGGIIWHLHTKSRRGRGGSLSVTNTMEKVWKRDLDEEGMIPVLPTLALFFSKNEHKKYLFWNWNLKGITSSILIVGYLTNRVGNTVL